MNPSFHRCDCGRLAQHRDGSGWFCAPCGIAVRLAQAQLDEHITKTRAHANAPAIADRIAAYYKLYHARRKPKIEESR